MNTRCTYISYKFTPWRSYGVDMLINWEAVDLLSIFLPSFVYSLSISVVPLEPQSQEKPIRSPKGSVQVSIKPGLGQQLF